MKTKPTEIYSTHDWWKQTGRKTVADYLESAVTGYELYVIEVEGNSFLALLLDDLSNLVNPKFNKFTVTSLLSATCFQSEVLANSMLRLLAKSNGIDTKRLKISKLSNYLKP
ncbi:hypothetical protein [Limosilactobacillus reuteri]|uniref:hypothetical protein n=1 Tax=Limosilactobacillus reuteri TaxID=1598 RepID=UPI0007A9394F|nr:hypothetical protein [Limosilactobacillus reuteri]AMY14832.1 hypothetical protein ADV92_10030 [Limosilactobacillus reuteri]MCC4466903.1 hypothetical protein [Limosilactobacillus reuteri]MCC4473439.1 hypothetical protein [Limosilactobacillus reuteri]MCC4487545.1 hypothetical protein [Limosilactobacillus reuteri]OTA46546.1 hypothetical protein BHL89_05640 [Limosilactobacillus reuteri]